VTINVSRNGGWLGSCWLWVSLSSEGTSVSAEPSQARLLAIKVERLVREPFLADVRRLGYRRAIERLEVAVAAIRALAAAPVVIVDRGAAPMSADPRHTDVRKVRAIRRGKPRKGQAARKKRRGA